MSDLETHALNSAQHLYLSTISEPRDNSLRILVQEAVVNTAGLVMQAEANHPLAHIMSEYGPIESTANCKSFELNWEHYVAYQVTEELAGSCGNFSDEVYVGGVFRIYSDSHFLRYLSQNTGGHTTPVQHYKLICLNHLIDIASYEPPRIVNLGTNAPVSGGVQ